MHTSEVLNAAADLIEERGWVTGEGWPIEADSDRPLCLEGGIMAALGIVRDEIGLLYADCPAYEAMAAYLGRDPQPPLMPVSEALWQWNDAHDRTASEVIEVLRAVAVIEAAKEEAVERVTA